MLYSIDTFECIKYIPHQTSYDWLRNRLTEQEFHAIYDELLMKISGKEVATSSWIPGSNWEDTVYDPLYKVAGNEEEAGKLFGLIVWVVFLEHPETWSFGRYKKDGIPIRGLTYFKVDVDC